MKKLLKAMSAAAVGVLSCAVLAVTAYAEDYTFDVSGATETNGQWGQSFSYYTALGNEEFAANFNPMWMTSDSEVIVDYTYTGEANGAPVELIWQTWDDGPAEPNPDVTKNWNKVTPYEYTDTEAKFSFSDIAAKYGSDNFDTVYAICVGDTGVNLTVTGMKITNCDITAPAETEAVEAETEAETEEVTEEETEAQTEEETEETAEEETEAEETAEEEEAEETTVTEATTVSETTAKETTAKETTASEGLTRPNAAEIAANAPQSDSIVPIVIIIVVVVVVAAAAIVIIIMMIKKNKGKYY